MPSILRWDLPLFEFNFVLRFWACFDCSLFSDSALTPANISANINSIPMLNGSNFKSWKENLEIVLGVMDLDLALREDCPPPLIDKSTSDDKREKERWEKLNRICMMIMKRVLFPTTCPKQQCQKLVVVFYNL